MKKVEITIERALFASRWLMAPMYIGLVAALAMLVIGFLNELLHLLAGVFEASQHDMILGILSLIDLSLAGNLLLIVIFSGYENFISKMNISEIPESEVRWLVLIHLVFIVSGVLLALMDRIAASTQALKKK